MSAVATINLINIIPVRAIRISWSLPEHVGVVDIPTGLGEIVLPFMPGHVVPMHANIHVLLELRLLLLKLLLLLLEVIILLLEVIPITLLSNLSLLEVIAVIVLLEVIISVVLSPKITLPTSSILTLVDLTLVHLALIQERRRRINTAGEIAAARRDVRIPHVVPHTVLLEDLGFFLKFGF
jgi:hypothetical protein